MMNIFVYIVSVISLTVLIIIAVYITYQQVRMIVSTGYTSINILISTGEAEEAAGGRETDPQQPQHQPK